MMRFIRHEYTQLALGITIAVLFIVFAVHFGWGGGPCDWDMDVWVCH